MAFPHQARTDGQKPRKIRQYLEWRLRTGVGYQIVNTRIEQQPFVRPGIEALKLSEGIIPGVFEIVKCLCGSLPPVWLAFFGDVVLPDIADAHFTFVLAYVV